MEDNIFDIAFEVHDQSIIGHLVVKLPDDV